MRKQLFLCSLFGMLALFPRTATADIAPDSATENLQVTIAQNQPLEVIFPNVYDTLHAKELQLNGNLVSPYSGSLAIFFDWFDPAGNHFFSPVQEIAFAPTAATPVDITFTIPYCPPQVSVDFRLADAPLVSFIGTFTHTCLDRSVPDGGSTIILLCGGLAALAALRRRS